MFRAITSTFAVVVQLSVWAVSLTATGAAAELARLLLPVSAILLVASVWLRPDVNAWRLSLLACWLPFLVLVLMPNAGQTPWLPIGVMTSGVAIVTVVTNRLYTGAALLAIFTILHLWIFNDAPAHIRMAASYLHGVPVLLSYQLAFSIGALLAYRAADKYSKEAAARARYVQQLEEAETVLEQQRHDRLRAVQRLHETVLNTLRAVGRRPDGEALDLAEHCAEDLAVLEDWRYESLPHTVQEVVETSISSVNLGNIAVHVQPDRDLTLNAETSDAIRSMLTELLLNVGRHSRASNVYLSWSVLDDMRLVFTVEDDGIGISDKNSGRLGIRRIVRGIAAALDGQVLLADRPGGGTTVTLRIRLRAPGVQQPVGRFAVDVPRAIFKIMAQAVLIWAIMVSPVIVVDLRNPVAIAAISILATGLLLFAVTSMEQPSAPILLGALAMTSLNLFFAESFSDSCASASSLQWLMNIFIITCMVSVVFGQVFVRVIAAIVALIVPVLLLAGVHADCSELVWLPWLSMLTLVLPTIAFARTRSAIVLQPVDETRLDALLSEQLRRERHADERRLRWAAAVDRSRQVMQEIAYTGAVNAGIRQRAEVADAQLRGQLLIEPNEDGALAAFALSLIDEAAAADVAVKAEVLNVSRRSDPLPEAALAQIRQVLARAQGEAQLKLFVVGDEESMTMIVPIVPGSIPAFSDGTPAEGFVEMTYGDLRLEFDPQDVDASGLLPLWISISRPIA